MAEVIQQTNKAENPRRETFFQRWTKRIWNFIPTIEAVQKGVSYCTKKFLANTKNGLKNDFTELKDFLKKSWKTLNAFTPYDIQSKTAKATHCPLHEKPIIIKIESNKRKNKHFHGGAYYDGIAIDSDGRGNNATPTGTLDAPVDTTANYFVLYPSKLGISPTQLKNAFKTEASKSGDYDFYLNNCINHVIRPLKKCGIDLNFGEIATPKELCTWCDEQCMKNAGFYLNETEYQKLLTNITAQKETNKRNINTFCTIANVFDMAQKQSDHQKHKGQKTERRPSIVQTSKHKPLPYVQQQLERCA